MRNYCRARAVKYMCEIINCELVVNARKWLNYVVFFVLSEKSALFVAKCTKALAPTKEL